MPSALQSSPSSSKKPCAGKARAEGDQVGILRRGAGRRHGRAEVDGVVDRRRAARALEADEGRREPGVEERRRQRRVEQTRLARADPGAGVGSAAGEGRLAEGRPDAVVLEHLRHARHRVRGRRRTARRARRRRASAAPEKPLAPQSSESTASAVACTLPSCVIRAERKVTRPPSRSTSTADLDRPGGGRALEVDRERARRPLAAARPGSPAGSPPRRSRRWALCRPTSVRSSSAPKRPPPRSSTAVSASNPGREAPALLAHAPSGSG